jgi:hypothetical protein
MTIAVAVAALAVGYSVWPAPVTRSRPIVPARTSEVPPPPRYGARELLAAGLDLSTTQRTALMHLAAEWDEESTGLEDRIRAARVEFETFMETTKQRRGASVAEIQARSADLREMSGILRQRSEAHRAAALAVLTSDQRQRLGGGPQTTQGGAR